VARKSTIMNKAFVQDWNTLSEMDDTQRLCRAITERQIAALATLTEYLGWLTRYDNPPSQDVLNAFSSETLNNLITEGCDMNCEELIECLQPLFDAIDEQFQAVQDQLYMMQYGDTNAPNVPLSPTKTAQNLASGTNPTCNKNVLWAQSTQTVDYAVQLVHDALELAASATNDVELIKVITALPGLDEVGADALAGYIDLLLEGVALNFDAQVTDAYKEEVSCQIFCAAVNCNLSLDTINGVMIERVNAHFPGFSTETFANSADLLLYFVDQEIEGTIIADVLLSVVIYGGVLSNIFLGDVGTKALETVLRLAVNDANSDWLILCPDCPQVLPVLATVELPGNDTGLDLLNGTAYSVTSAGMWTGGTGVSYDADGQIGAYEPTATLPTTAYVYSLIWRVGTTGTWYPGGTSFTIPDTITSGRLYFMINDCDGCRADNSGSLMVTVEVA